MKLLLTGATGFLGREILIQALSSDFFTKIVVCIRPWAGVDAVSRFSKIIDDLSREGVSAAKLHGMDFLEWDISDSSALNTLPAAFDLMIHAAALTRLDMSLLEARKHNLLTTQNIVRLACLHKAKIVYVSTAFADVSRGFRNYYELSKYEAELCVKESGLDYTVVKPSMIIGRSTNGQTRDFRLFLSMMRVWLSLDMPVLPVAKKAFVFTVPVDVVADYCVHAKCNGEVQVVTSGPLSNDELISYASSVFGRKKPFFLPRFFISLLKTKYFDWIFSQRYRDVLATFRSHLDYVDLKENTIEDGVLENDETWKLTVNYAKSSHWGKRYKKNTGEKIECPSSRES